MQVSQQKRSRIQKALIENKLDALFCRISEHVLYFTGYLPHNHVGIAVVPAEGKPVLLIPELEAKNEFQIFPPSSDVEIVTFPLESGTELRGHNEAFTLALPSVFEQLGFKDKTIGIEKNFEMINTSVFQGEVKYPGQPTWDMLAKLLPGANFVDATGVLTKLRSIKSEEEIQAIKTACEIACLGFAAGRETLKPGMTEAELSAVIESAIQAKGTGYKGVAQARGYAFVYAGENSANQNLHYARYSNRAIEQDEVVIIELATIADGYWSDLTRNFCAGKPSQKYIDMFEAVLGAQKAALKVVRAGAPIPALHRASSDYFEKVGYPRYWPHALGHGVGHAYHEGPFLHEVNDSVIEAGMVLTIEPGLYIEGIAGFRPEDIVAVREDGYEMLSDFFPHKL